MSSVFASACAKGNGRLPVKELVITTASGQSVKVAAEIADTPQTRHYGFMFRKKIPEGTGMLFIFEEDQELSFWMKNTPTPLSIAYIDYKGEIKDIFDMEPYSLTSITSSALVRYAMEVPQGWYEKVGVKIGDRLGLGF
jgi:Uncharacterized conserved protein